MHAYMARLQQIREIITTGPLSDVPMSSALGQEIARILDLTRMSERRGRPRLSNRERLDRLMEANK